ncbi:MAG: molecular chaperone GrpE, partial [Abditibacteriota bacterium]|nr:molecular chaperone GrpE [Abditibacteriota bacterium]
GANPQEEGPEEGANASAASGADGSFDDSDAVTAAHAEWNEKYLRLAADFENFKRLAQRREAEVRERTVRNIFEDLLPVLDNFERAVQAAQNATDVTSLRIGVEYILKQLHESLREHGVEPMETRGQKFDPLHHEALEEIADSGQTPGTVLDEAQRGYSFKGQVLRPARVRVAG